MTSDEKNTCKEIAREIVSEVLKQHIDSCPHGMKIHKAIWLSIGMGVGSGIFGGSAFLTIVRLFGA